MKEPQEATNDWPAGNILWFAVMIWFSSRSERAVTEASSHPNRREISGKGWCLLPAKREAETTPIEMNTRIFPTAASMIITSPQTR
ncbi:hypothetical protein N9M83_01940 [Candidatus Poseidonia alphae]|nr:hypothetical protein [Candidatus Poseidonia alphae]